MRVFLLVVTVLAVISSSLACNWKIADGKDGNGWYVAEAFVPITQSVNGWTANIQFDRKFDWFEVSTVEKFHPIAF